MNLTDTCLIEADLTSAELGGADLSGAEFGGADLATARNLIRQQLDSANGDGETKLPARRHRPAHWSAGPAVPPAADQ